MGIDVYRGHARDLVFIDIDHRAPFGEPRAPFVIFLQTLGELVQPDGNQFTGTVRQRLRTLVDLDAGDRPRLLDHLHQRRAIPCLLPDGLVVEDDTRDVPGHRFAGAKQHFAIVAARFLGRYDADVVEAL